MQVKKCLVYVAFVLFPAFDSIPFLGTTSDCHSRISDAYFSTLLQADKQGQCDICKIGGVNVGFITSTYTETILSGRYPVISVFGTKPVIPSRMVPWAIVTSSGMIGSRMIIKGPLNPLVTALLVPWESDMKNFWALSRLAKW